MKQAITHIGSALFTALLVFAPAAASAAGFSSHSHKGAAVSAAGYAQTYAYLVSPYAKVKTTNSAKASTETLFGGAILSGKGTASSNTHIDTFGKKSCGCSHDYVKVHTKNEAKSKLFIKGKSVLVKARAKNYVKLEVKGKLWYEHESTAVAMVRHTPLGSQGKAYAFNENKLAVKGFVRLSSGSFAATSGRTRN